MPKVILSLPNTEETVSKAVVSSLVEQLKKLTNLTQINDVRFKNYASNTRLPNMAVGEDKSRYASLSGTTRIFVEVEEDYNQNGFASTVVERIEHVPVFADPDLDFWVVPVVIPSDLSIKLKIQTRSREEARMWRDDIIAKLAQLRDGMQHRVIYALELPVNVWALIRHVHALREGFAGYGEDIDTYIKQHSDKDLTLVSNHTGEQSNFSFRRVLNRVNGMFDISPFPEKPVFDENGGMFECVLTYKVTYDRPTSCVVDYPIQVHQSFLEDIYIVPEESPNMNDRKKKLSQSQQAFSMFESYKLSGYYCRQDAFITIPPFDDYVYTITPKGTATCLQCLLALEKPEPQVLMNLGGLGDDEIDSDILQFFREVEYPYLTKPYQSFFFVQIYRGSDMLHDENIEVTETLDVLSKLDFDLRKSYRIRFSIVIDPTLVPYSAFERLYNYPRVIWKLVAAINEAVRYNVDGNDTRYLRHLKPYEFSKLWHMLNGLRPLPEIGYGTNNSGRTPQTTGKGNHGVNTGRWPEFGIPDDVYNKLNNSGRMRTVQIHGTIVHKR